MLALAFEIFGLVSLVTGICLLALAVYLKFAHDVKLRGFRPMSASPGGGMRFLIAAALSLMVGDAGTAMLGAVRRVAV